MAEKNTITARQQETLEAVNRGKNDVQALADQLGVTVATVRGTLRALRENGLLEGTSGDLTVTSDGQAYVGQGGNQAKRSNRGGNQQQGTDHRDGSKIAQAKQVFEQFFDQGRKAVLEQFVNRLKLTPAGASTYYQNLRHETGMAFQNARGQATGDGRRNNGGNRGNKGNQGKNQGKNQGGRGRAKAAGTNKAGNMRGMNRGNSNRPSAS